MEEETRRVVDMEIIIHYSGQDRNMEIWSINLPQEHQNHTPRTEEIYGNKLGAIQKSNLYLI